MKKSEEILSKQQAITKAEEELEDAVIPIYNRVYKKLDVNEKQSRFFVTINLEYTDEDSLGFNLEDKYNSDYDSSTHLLWSEVDMSDEEFEEYILKLKIEKIEKENKESKKKLKDKMLNLQADAKRKLEEAKLIQIQLEDEERTI